MAGSANTAAPRNPNAVATPVPPTIAPVTSTRASADDEAMAEAVSAQPVSAGSRPRRRSCR